MAQSRASEADVKVETFVGRGRPPISALWAMPAARRHDDPHLIRRVRGHRGGRTAPLPHRDSHAVHPRRRSALAQQITVAELRDHGRSTCKGAQVPSQTGRRRAGSRPGRNYRCWRWLRERLSRTDEILRKRGSAARDDGVGVVLIIDEPHSLENAPLADLMNAAFTRRGEVPLSLPISSSRPTLGVLWSPGGPQLSPRRLASQGLAPRPCASTSGHPDPLFQSTETGTSEGDS